jgi:hypothetical protein
MDFVQRVCVFARKGGKELTAVRWIMMPFSVSQAAQVMAALTWRLRLAAANLCGQGKTAQEVRYFIIVK